MAPKAAAPAMAAVVNIRSLSENQTWLTWQQKESWFRVFFSSTTWSVKKQASHERATLWQIEDTFQLSQQANQLLLWNDKEQDPGGLTVRYQVMQLCIGSVHITHQCLVLGGKKSA